MSGKQTSIAIVGGGISGIALASALLQRGISVQIYEQAHAFCEIGSGLAFGPNAIRAMQKCSPKVYEAMQKVATKNQSPDKQTIWFEFRNGYDQSVGVGEDKTMFTVYDNTGNNAVHRAHFLDEMVKLVPAELTHFRKRLDTIEEPETAEGKLVLKFLDGTTAEADAVIGCDGIKSRTRAWMLGEDHPSTKPSYTFKYAYRGVIPMERAAEALGTHTAGNGKFYMGQDGHVLTVPIARGAMMHVTAFRTTSEPWEDTVHLTKPATKKVMRQDFQHFGTTVHKIIDMMEPTLDIWAIFDTGAHPVPYYNKGRVVVVGDAGHATSPHHGAGAGMCIEDAAILSELIAAADLDHNGAQVLEKVFQVYSDVRLERTHFLVQSSRRCGDLYEWRVPEHGNDGDKIGAEVNERAHRIWDADFEGMVKEAKDLLAAKMCAKSVM